MKPTIKFPSGKPRILETKWGNWYGYLGTRKVAMFNADSEGSAQSNANLWLAVQRAKAGIQPEIQIIRDNDKDSDGFTRFGCDVRVNEYRHIVTCGCLTTEEAIADVRAWLAKHNFNEPEGWV